MATGTSSQELSAPPTLDYLVNEIGVPRKKLNKPCSDEHLLDIAPELACWVDLSPYLGLKEDEVEAIRSESGTERGKRLKCLREWKNKNGMKATYKALIEALLKCNMASHAEKVCRLLAANPEMPRDASAYGKSTATSSTTDKALASAPTTTNVDPILQQNIMDEIRELEKKYDDLVNEFEGSLIDTDISEVKKLLTRLPASLTHSNRKLLEPEAEKAIESKTSIRELFTFLYKRYWDFMNCGLLRHIVDRLGNPKINESMETYLDELRKFRTKTKLKDLIPWEGTRYTEISPVDLVLKLGKEWEDLTLEDLEQFRIGLALQCSIEAYAMRFRSGVPGSISVTFGLPTSVDISALHLQDHHEFLKQHHVLRITAGGSCIIDTTVPKVGVEQSSPRKEKEQLQLPERRVQITPQVNLENPLVYLDWKDYTTLPVGMQHAQAVVVGNKVYVGGGMTTDTKGDTNIYVFDHTIKRPEVTSIPTPGPTRWSTLASFHSQLVLAGGTIDSRKATNELWALRDDGCSWEQRFPPMPQACWGASAVSSGDHLLIAGGVGSDHPLTTLDTVQIYSASSKKWVLSKPLPKCCYFMKSTLLDGDWYLAGGRWQYRKIFHASLESLIETSRKKEIWKSLPDTSRRCCSISACHGQLIAVGGVIYSGPSREIQIYSTKKRSWIDVEHLPHHCDSTCTIVLPMEKIPTRPPDILLIGGNTHSEYQCHEFSNRVTKASTNEIKSLDQEFSQSALRHIEITTGISVYNPFLCGRMDANTDSTWLLRDLKSSHDDQPATWRDLLRHMKDPDKGMTDVANDIEHLFKAAPDSPRRSSVHEAILQPIDNTKLEKEYELKEELGRGGFGVVYHVKNKFDLGDFALKITQLPKLDQHDEVMREVHVLVMLDHPKILRYYTSWAEGVKASKVKEALETQRKRTMACAEYASEGSSKQELPYCLHIQTQLCNKDTLKDWLEKNQHNRQKKTVFGFFEQIHEAVVYIHQKGLLHRDLNPSNVFFSREGGSVKVGDFGLVSGVNVDDDTTQHEGQQKKSHCGQVGKWLYMPPEQRAEKNYDVKVDIYALGVIFFELNCPFSTPKQRLDVLVELQSQQKLPSTFTERLPKEAKLIELMLASDPAKRPSAKEISESDCLKKLRETVERSGTETIPLHPSAVPKTSPEDAKISKDSGVYSTPSHSVTESQYPGLHFLQGSPWRESVTSDGRKISWDDIGIQFDIPAGAIPEERVVHLNVSPCLSGRFILPDGCNLASPVFMVSPEYEFQEDVKMLQSFKEVMMSMVHFMDLQSEDECERMVFISASSAPIDQDGKPEYHFKVLKHSKKGAFHIGQRYGSISLNHFCFLAIGMQDKGPVKYSVQLYKASDKALFSVAICHPVYDTSLRSALEKQCPGVTFQHSARADVKLSGEDVSLHIPTDSMSGWDVIPDITPCQISKDEVDLPLTNPDYASETALIYPPRVWLTLVHPQVTPHTRTRNCVLPIHGLTKSYSFNIQLRSTAQGQEYNHQLPSSSDAVPHHSDKPMLHQLLCLHCQSTTVRILDTIAAQWEDVAIALDFEGSVIETVRQDTHHQSVPACRTIFQKWLAGGGCQPANWSRLIQALTDARLIDLAEQIKNIVRE